MVTIHADPVPLETWPDGSIRVGGTRVTLETILGAHLRGEGPQEIADNFPTVGLANVYATIAYYHRHPDEVGLYLAGVRALEEKAYAELDRTAAQQRLNDVLERRGNTLPR